MDMERFTTFDAPGAGTGFFKGTFVTAINAPGDIAGFSIDTNFLHHGFLRTSDGAFTTLDFPGAAAPFGTYSYGINPARAITGVYVLGPPNFLQHCYLWIP